MRSPVKITWFKNNELTPLHVEAGRAGYILAKDKEGKKRLFLLASHSYSDYLDMGEPCKVVQEGILIEIILEDMEIQEFSAGRFFSVILAQ